MPGPNQKVDVFKFVDMSGGPDACWEWKVQAKGGGKDNRPYFQYKGKRRLAYRIVYELVRGVHLQSSDMILHSCDNPRCCNPAHHRIGNNQENMDDMKQRERHGLPRTVVRAIRRLLDEGNTHQEIASRFGVARETITAIANRRVHEEK